MVLLVSFFTVWIYYAEYHSMLIIITHNLTLHLLYMRQAAYECKWESLFHIYRDQEEARRNTVGDAVSTQIEDEVRIPRRVTSLSNNWRVNLENHSSRSTVPPEQFRSHRMVWELAYITLIGSLNNLDCVEWCQKMIYMLTID